MFLATQPNLVWGCQRVGRSSFIEGPCAGLGRRSLIEGPRAEIYASLSAFDVSDAHCFDPNEENKLRRVIEARGAERFNNRSKYPHAPYIRSRLVSIYIYIYVYIYGGRLTSSPPPSLGSALFPSFTVGRLRGVFFLICLMLGTNFWPIKIYQKNTVLSKTL